MKRLKRFENFIEESYLLGSRAPLYHTAPITNSYGILKEDKLKSTVIPDKFWSANYPAPRVISFTRNKDFIYENYPVTFVLDGDKLKNKFKIRPMDYFVKTVGTHMKPKSMRAADNFEFEEAVEAKEINDLHKFLIEIRLNDSLFQYYKNHPRNSREEFRESYEDLIKMLIFYKAHHDTKVTLQDGREWSLQDLRDEAKDFPDSFNNEKLVLNVEPETEIALDKMFDLDDPLIKAINNIVKPAHEMAIKGETRPDKMLTRHGESIAARILRDAYFPGHPQFVSNKHFDVLAKSNPIYYRGVRDKKFVDDLHYNITKFMGHSNMYQGTWITDNIDLAKEYHYDDKPLEIIVKKDAKIADDKEIDKLRNQYMRKMRELENYADREIDGDRFKMVHHEAHYLGDYLMNSAVLAVAFHFDGIVFNEGGMFGDHKVMVIFNREKLVVRDPDAKD